MKPLRLFTISLLLLFTGYFVNSQNIGIQKNNPDFLEYLSSEEIQTGYVPLPFEMPTTPVGTKRSGESFPSQFDSRNVNGTSYILAPRNQVITGPCWAFAATDVVQASFYKKGYQEGYLSPQLLTNCHNFVYTKTQGGNSLMAVATFARLVGPAFENAVPYDANETACMATTKEDFPAFVSNVHMINNNIDAVKKAIMDNGSVATKMFYDVAYYNSADKTYFYNGAANENHGISIVGWNDNMVVADKGYGTPSASGVWIVKNTWGTGFGDGGYFYVSYEDTYVGKEVFAFTKRIDKNTIDKVYQYAQHGMTSSVGYTANNPSYGRIKFTTTEREKIAAVGLYTYHPNTEITFWIYEGTDFSKLRYTSEAEVIQYGGYYTIDITAPIYITGDFQVIVSYKHSTEAYTIPIEQNYPNYNNATIQNSGVQWISSSGSSWAPLGADTSYKFNLCINAYTSIPNPPANDNVQDAVLLNTNTVYENFTNAGATVQANEVVPPYNNEEASCYTQNSWCYEGGVQNSVWFKFVATNPVVNIITEGFDNQIALWQSNDDNAENLISGNTSTYQLLAANDDASVSNAFASLYNVQGLQVGKTYFIQVDGSANGAEGIFSIEIQDIPTSINSTTHASTLLTPEGELTQEIKDKVNYIEVFDVSGRLLQILPKNSSLSNSKLPKQQVLIIKLHYTDGGSDTISWLQN